LRNFLLGCNFFCNARRFFLLERVKKEKSNMKIDTLPIKKRKNSLVPTHKVFTGLSAGSITALIVYELHTRFNIDLAPIEGSFLTVILSFAASWLAPNSPAPFQ